MTPPAVAATDRLSSSRTGIVSTSAATRAAAMGARIVNASDGGGDMAGRHHQARHTPAAAPQTANATLPLTVFLRFHGQRGPPMARPASVAMPSPAARMPHAAAMMSG